MGFQDDTVAIIDAISNLALRVRELEAVEVAVGGGVGAHTILDGTVHTDSAVDTVTEGSLMYGNATPKWDELVHPGAVGYALVSGATSFAWDQTPQWTGDHSWISSTSAKPVLTLENTNADDLSSIIDFYKNSPADDDILGEIDFSGETSTGAKERYARILGTSMDVTNGDTAGGILLSATMDGNSRGMIYIGGYNGSVNEGEVIINYDDQDVDFVVRASGVADAFQVQGSDGQITLGALGAGFVQSSALGVLSSGAIGPGDLPAHTHAGAGEGGPLVVGTTDTGATAGSILFAGVAGVIQEDNANLFWDDTNNELGIGTTSPDGTLHSHTATAGAVTADAAADDLVVENSASGGISILTPDASPGALYFGSPTDNVGAIVLYQANTTSMVIGTQIAGGTVEVRTGNNTSAFTVNASQSIIMSVANTATLDMGGIADSIILDGDGDTTISAPTDDQIDIEIDGADDFTFTANSFDVLSGSNISMADGSAIGISAAERIVFYTAGYISLLGALVGIDKPSPATLLHVDFSGHTPYAQNTVTGAVFLESDPNAGSGNFGPGIVFGEVSGSAQPHRGAAIYIVQTSADGNDMGLGFATHDSAAGDPRIEAMRIDHDQNVVIGNTSPAAKLHVDQNSASAAVPVLLVDQADVSEGFINYVAASAASVANPISTWTTGNTIQGFVRIEINGAAQWMPYYDAPTS